MNESRRSSWVSGPLGVLAYLVGLAAVVALIIFLYPPETGAPEATPETPGSTTTAAPEVQVTAPTGEEPVADAAEVILPSVGCIQTPCAVGSGVFSVDDRRIISTAHVVGDHPPVVYIQTPSGVGSGVIYDDQGRIITAAHVVGAHQQVEIRFSNGRLVTGQVLGKAPEVDIAVIQAEPSGLPPAKFDTSKPRVG